MILLRDNLMFPQLVDFAVLEDRMVSLLMNYLPGDTMEKLVELNGSFSPHRCRLIAEQLLKALACIHSFNLVFCDLAPRNVIIGPDDTLKLVDFGKAIEAGTRHQVHRSWFHGTWGPEVYTQPMTCKADVWSLGILLFFGHTGKYPFGRCSFGGGMYLNLEHSMWFNERLKMFIERTLVIEPEKRASVEELMQDDFITSRVLLKISDKIKRGDQIQGQPEEYTFELTITGALDPDVGRVADELKEEFSVINTTSKEAR